MNDILDMTMDEVFLIMQSAATRVFELQAAAHSKGKGKNTPNFGTSKNMPVEDAMAFLGERGAVVEE